MMFGIYERNRKDRKARLNRKYEDAEGHVGILRHNAPTTNHSYLPPTTASTSTSHARVRRSSAATSTSSYAWVRWWSSTTTSPSNDAWVCWWSAATSSNAWFRWSPATSSTTWLLWRTAASTWCTTTSGCQDGWLASGAYL